MAAHIDTKFHPGQKVWVMFENKPKEAKISSVEIRLLVNADKPFIYYEVSFGYGWEGRYSESRIFATKEELKEAIFGI